MQQLTPRERNGVARIVGSSIVGLFFLGLALYAQTPHTKDAFFQLGHDHNSEFSEFNSWSYAIALELAVLYFVVRGNFAASYIFACVSVAMNVAYYTIHGNNMLDIANWTRWLVSVSLPLAIAYYSHCIAEADNAPLQWLIRLRAYVQSRVVAKIAWLRKPARSVVQPQKTTPDSSAQSTSDLQSRISLLRSEQLDDKTIALRLDDVSDYALAKVLGVAASTVGRWRKSAQSNGHDVAKTVQP